MRQPFLLSHPVEEEEEELAHPAFPPAPVSGGSGGGLFPSPAAAFHGNYAQVPRDGLPLPPRQVPAGGRDVRLRLHDRRHGHRPLPRRLQAHGLLPGGLLPEVHLHRRGVAHLARLQLPAALHLLPPGGAGEPVRLLGDVRRALGEQDLHQLDQSGGVRAARGHPAVLPDEDLHHHLLQHEEEGSAVGARRHQGGLQRNAQDGENDFCDNNGVHGVLEPLFRRAAVVGVEPEQRADARSHIFNYHAACRSQQLHKPLDLSLLQLKGKRKSEKKTINWTA